MSTAFPHQPVGQPFVIAGELVDYGGHGALHVFANLAGLPALAVPAGSSADGLPIGIQLVGPRWSDLRLIAIAHAMEGVGVLPGFSRPDGLGD